MSSLLTKRLNKMAQTNAILFVIVILLSLLAWFQPGLQQPVYQYLTSLKTTTIHSIIIERQALGTIKLHKENNNWVLQEPYQLPASLLRINTITALAQKRSYAQFQIDDTELSRYGLDKPAVSVWLNETNIIIGAEDPIKGQRYAMNISDNIQTGKNTVQLINGVVFYQLRANLDSFIATQLLPPKAQIKSITWADKKLNITQGKWTLTPDLPEVSADSIAQLIHHWQTAQASRVQSKVSLSINNAQLQQSPAITIHFSTDSGLEESVHYLIIQDAGQIKLLRSDAQVAYWLSPDLLKQLTKFLPVLATN